VPCRHDMLLFESATAAEHDENGRLTSTARHRTSVDSNESDTVSSCLCAAPFVPDPAGVIDDQRRTPLSKFSANSAPFRRRFRLSFDDVSGHGCW
jgi:hypothetical protein